MSYWTIVNCEKCGFKPMHCTCKKSTVLTNEVEVTVSGVRVVKFNKELVRRGLKELRAQLSLDKK